MRDDLLIEVARLARAGRFDYLLIESTGIGEPLPVAATFTFETDEGDSLSHVARLDTMVTVIDAERFVRDLGSLDDLRARQLALSDEDERTIPDLLIDQVEFANVLVINKVDRVSAHALGELQAMLRHLNPDAEQLLATRGVVPPSQLLGTYRFDFEKAEAAPGWQKELAGVHIPETEEYGIASFVYRARRPMHADRFWALLNEGDPLWTGVLRSKGFFWLASRHDVVGLWSHAGGAGSAQAAGVWFATAAKDEWPTEQEEREELERVWEEAFGDRRQELVFIGKGMNEAAMRSALDACLLGDAELAGGAASWRGLPDPFPEWQRGGGERGSEACPLDAEGH